MKPATSSSSLPAHFEPESKQDKLAMKFPGLALPNDPEFDEKYSADSAEKKDKKKKKKKDKDRDKDLDTKPDTKPNVKTEKEADVIDDAMAALEALAPSAG